MLIFAVVIVPWRPLETFTRSVFQAEACWLLSLALPQKKIKAEVSQDPQHTTIDTRITLSDLRDVRPDGQARLWPGYWRSKYLLAARYSPPSFSV
jgi:hypothetical protein